MLRRMLVLVALAVAWSHGERAYPTLRVLCPCEVGRCGPCLAS